MVEETEVKTLLHEGYNYLPVLQNCSPLSTDRPEIDQQIELEAFPNPFQNWTTIKFSTESEWAELSIFDALGAKIRVLVDRDMQAGQHEVRFDANGLPAGTYFYRLQLNGRVRTRRFIKQ